MPQNTSIHQYLHGCLDLKVTKVVTLVFFQNHFVNLEIFQRKIQNSSVTQSMVAHGHFLVGIRKYLSSSCLKVFLVWEDTFSFKHNKVRRFGQKFGLFLTFDGITFDRIIFRWLIYKFLFAYLKEHCLS